MRQFLPVFILLAASLATACVQHNPPLVEASLPDVQSEDDVDVLLLTQGGPGQALADAVVSPSAEPRFDLRGGQLGLETPRQAIADAVCNGLSLSLRGQARAC